MRELKKNRPSNSDMPRAIALRYIILRMDPETTSEYDFLLISMVISISFFTPYYRT